MRIAVSGTHGSGKSTLIDDFLAAHPDYVHEPEPYEQDGVLFETPGVDEFYAQLERSVEILRGHTPGARVIAERSPVDFLAYLLALHDLRRGGHASDVIGSAAELAVRGMAHVDLLVVLPLEDAIDVPESEDLLLREAMNERLLELIANDEFDVLRRVRVLEVHGSPSQRLAMLERVLSVPL